MDVMPTILTLMNVQVPADLDGRAALGDVLNRNVAGGMVVGRARR
jgi:hypothetical protein